MDPSSLNTRADFLSRIVNYDDRDMTDDFIANLEQALAAITPDEPFILLEDLNACMSSRNNMNDLWERVQGLHGCGEANDAGKELLTFLSTTEATV